MFHRTKPNILTDFWPPAFGSGVHSIRVQQRCLGFQAILVLLQQHRTVRWLPKYLDVYYLTLEARVQLYGNSQRFKQTGLFVLILAPRHRLKHNSCKQAFRSIFDELLLLLAYLHTSQKYLVNVETVLGTLSVG